MTEEAIRKVIAKKFPHHKLMSRVAIDSLGNITTQPMGAFSKDDLVRYEFCAESLRVGFDNEEMRARFGAELRRGTILPERDIQPDLLAALYGEQSNWCFVKCEWTLSFVIFHLVRQECLKKDFPTNETLCSTRFRVEAPIMGYEDGYVRLSIPVHSLDGGVKNSFIFSVDVTAETGEYQMMETIVFPQILMVAAAPRSMPKSGKYPVFYLSHAEREREDAKYQAMREIEEE